MRMQGEGRREYKKAYCQAVQRSRRANRPHIYRAKFVLVK